MIPFSRLFMIGTSAGGVSALHKIFEALSPEVVDPIVVIQHLPDLNHVNVAKIYSSGGDQRQIVEVEDKMPIEGRHVYFAPGGYHLLIERDETFSLTQDDPVRYSRPSIDLSFESAANVFGRRLTAVVMTGANSDGALGLTFVRQNGGQTVVQEPADAEFPEMPTAAINLQKPDFIVTVSQLPELILRLQNRGAQ